MKNKDIIIIILALTVLVLGYYSFSDKKRDATEIIFQKKQKCSQYSDLVNTKIEESGRVFRLDTYWIDELFYSPKLNTCLYAWRIRTNVGALGTETIYSIDDIFGGDVFTSSISEPFYKEIEKLKK